jgi:signal peptidase I
MRKIKHSLIAVTLILVIFTLSGCSLFPNRNVVVFNTAGESMYPTIKDGQRITVRVTNNVERGDIIAYRFYTSSGQYGNRLGAFDNHLKRLIAMGGDTITFVRISPFINNYVVYLNDEELDEDTYFSQFACLIRPSTSFTFDGNIFELTVPAGHMFVMGDNRAVSWDSRDFGTVCMTALIGKLIA